MSCNIMSTQSHATLANSLTYIMNSGFNRFGFEAPESLYKALRDCRDRYGDYSAEPIYNRLYSLNLAAYAGRYSKTMPADPVPDMPSVPQLIQPREYYHHEILLPWHYRFCKMLDCLIYQTSEDATRNDPLYLALLDFSRIYKSFLVLNTAEYHAAPWG